MVRLRITPTTDRDVCGGGPTRLLEAEIVAVILTWPTYPIHRSLLLLFRWELDMFTTRLAR